MTAPANDLHEMARALCAKLDRHELLDRERNPLPDDYCISCRDILSALQAVAQAGRERCAGIVRESLEKVLCQHWLFSVECNHAAKTDKPICACGVPLGEYQTVGDAVKRWAIHAVEAAIHAKGVTP